MIMVALLDSLRLTSSDWDLPSAPTSGAIFASLKPTKFLPLFFLFAVAARGW